MQLHELLVGFKFRIGFGHREDAAHTCTQSAFCLAQRGNVVTFARRLHLRSCGDHALQGLLLKLLVLLAHLDQLG